MAVYLCIMLGAVLVALIAARIKEVDRIFASTFLFVFVVSSIPGLAVSEAVLDDIASYVLSEKWFEKAALGYLPILAFAIALYSARGGRQASKSFARWELSPTGVRFCVCALALGSVVIVRYLALEGAERIVGWNQITDRASAYRTRYSFETGTLVGGASSYMFAYGLIPALCAILAVGWKGASKGKRVAVITVPYALCFLRSLATLQRAPIIIQVVMFVVTVAYTSGSLSLNDVKVKLRRVIGGLCIGVLVLVVVGGAVYQRSDKSAHPLYRLVQRIIIVPAQTAVIYFGLMGETLPFRPYYGLFYMPQGSWEGYLHEDTSVKLLGYFAAGSPHNANANVIATAYSAGGYGPAILCGLAHLFALVWFSRRLAQYGMAVTVLATVASLQFLVNATNNSILASLGVGGYISQVLTLALLRYGTRCRQWLPPTTAGTRMNGNLGGIQARVAGKQPRIVDN